MGYTLPPPPPASTHTHKHTHHYTFIALHMCRKLCICVGTSKKSVFHQMCSALAKSCVCGCVCVCMPAFSLWFMSEQRTQSLSTTLPYFHFLNVPPCPSLSFIPSFSYFSFTRSLMYSFIANLPPHRSIPPYFFTVTASIF